MPYPRIVWSDEIIDHIERHGISPPDFEHVVRNPVRKGWSRSSGLPVSWGYTQDGRYIMAVYEELDDATILPVTAYEVPEPR